MIERGMAKMTFHNLHSANDGVGVTVDGPALPDAGLDEMARLLRIMAKLRDPAGGCPWDQVQTFETIAPYTVEEAYEVADAIARQDMAALPDELGDLLLQVVYHARIAEEAGAFAFADVARAIGDKMERRHPLIFTPDTPVPVVDYESSKQAERAARRQSGTLDGVAAGLPALTLAHKLTQRAARVGFDWPDPQAVLAKLDEEVAELQAELPGADPARIADEMGDLLFVAANLARKLGVDPEACLAQACAKFTRRFQSVEQQLAAEGHALADATLEQMEGCWVKAKAAEARSGGSTEA